jgi:phosphoribosyl-dephospho-CoA transferase
MDWKRHTLLDISNAGREAILEELSGNGCDDGRHRESWSRVLLPMKAGARIPGIVRRDEQSFRPGYVPIGFSSPELGGEGRLRIAAFAQQKDIIRVTSPYDLTWLPVPPRTACMQTLAVVRVTAESLGLELGVWGSAALELYTELPYTHMTSDLDLLVKAAPVKVLFDFLAEILALERGFGLRIDVEVDLPDGYGVQLKEVLGHGRTVLGKSLTDVRLLPRAQLLAKQDRFMFPSGAAS